MAQISSLDISVYYNEFSENIEGAKNASMREKDAFVKKAIKTIVRLESYIGDTVKDFKISSLIEKAKEELNGASQLLKKKDASVLNVDRYVVNAARYFDIALREFREEFAKSNDFISHDRKIVDPLMK